MSKGNVEQKVAQAMGNKMVKGLGEDLVMQAFTALPTMPVHATSIAYAALMLRNDANVFDGLSWADAHDAIYDLSDASATITDDAGLVRRVPITPKMVITLAKSDNAIAELSDKLDAIRNAPKPAKASKASVRKPTWAELLGL